MNSLAQFKNQDTYLLVVVLNPWTLKVAKQVIDDSKKEAIYQGHHRILFDLTKWTRPDTEMTRFWSGEYLARQFPPPFKTAAFSLHQAINKFGENAAVNRGAQFRIFSDEKNAFDWLLKAS